MGITASYSEWLSGLAKNDVLVSQLYASPAALRLCENGQALMKAGVPFCIAGVGRFDNLFISRSTCSGTNCSHAERRSMLRSRQREATRVAPMQDGARSRPDSDDLVHGAAEHSIAG
jgi:hypothetical protein